MGIVDRTANSPDARLSRPGASAHRKPPRPTTCRTAESLQRPGADIHLVMNSFNRLVGEAPLDGSGHCEQIFNLSDYLRLSLSHTQPVEVSIQDELALLKSYLRLVSVFRGWTLDHAVSLCDSAKGVRLHSHTLCLIAQSVFHACALQAPGHWVLSFRLALQPGEALAADMRLQPISSRCSVRRASVVDALDDLCGLMSCSGNRWRHVVRAGPQSGLAVCVFIDRLGG